MNGVEIILRERKRQIEREHMTDAHDDCNQSEEMAIVAALYALPSGMREFGTVGEKFTVSCDLVEALWPPTWAAEWWKPAESFGDRIRELSKAGALIAAEIDRLLRMRKNVAPINSYTGYEKGD